MNNTIPDFAKKYRLLPKFNKDTTWTNSKRWTINREINEASNKVDPNCLVSKSDKKTCYVSLSIDDKDELTKTDYFKDHWKKSDWIAKRIDSSIVELSLNKHQGIFTGYLGKSNQNEDVSQLIWDRLHISSFFGITGFILSYLVCIPLGIMKALRHGSKFDMASSGLVFIAYSIP